MEAIFRWLAKVLAGILEKYADPQLEAQLEAFNAKVEKQEAERKRFLAEIEANELKLVELAQRLTDGKRKRTELDSAIAYEEASLAKRIADRARLSDADKVELDI